MFLIVVSLLTHRCPGRHWNTEESWVKAVFRIIQFVRTVLLFTRMSAEPVSLRAYVINNTQ